MGCLSRYRIGQIIMHRSCHRQPYTPFFLIGQNEAQILFYPLICVFCQAVTALAPLVIPEQPEGEWLDALADTPAVATPLETLSWLRTPDSPSLGKRAYDSDTSLASLVYGPAEYDVLTGPDGSTARLANPSGSNGQDDLEDREAKKPRIHAVIMSEVHQQIRSIIAAEGD